MPDLDYEPITADELREWRERGNAEGRSIQLAISCPTCYLPYKSPDGHGECELGNIESLAEYRSLTKQAFRLPLDGYTFKKGLVDNER